MTLGDPLDPPASFNFVADTGSGTRASPPPSADWFAESIA